MTLPDFEHNLVKYADLAVETGVEVRPGDTVYVQIDVTQAQLAHLIVAAAYKAGAAEVLVDWQDDTLKRLDIKYLADDRLAVRPPFVAGQFDYWLAHNAKRITVMSANPDNLAGVSPERVAAYNAGFQKAYSRLSNAITTNAISWTIIAAAGAEWAAKVFPEDDHDTAIDKLWDQIFTTTRVYTDDPNQAWRDHDARLSTKAEWLNQYQFDALHYEAPGTDLTVGLPQNHIWQAADSQNPRGETFMANMPTEEVFTVPDARRINGTVASTKPLAYSGNILDGMHFTFKDGEVVAFSAAKGQDTLGQLLQIKGAKSWVKFPWCPTHHQSRSLALPFSTHSLTKMRPTTWRWAKPTPLL